MRGHGRITGERTVQVGDETLTARRAVVIATGTEAAIPPIPGLREARPWTNREAVTAEEAPASLVVLGGGTVGVEMATAYASFGTSVTVIEAGPRVLAREEPFAGEEVCAALADAGVEIRADTHVTAVARSNGRVSVELDDGSSVSGDEVLVAVGRRILSADLGVEDLGVEPGRPIEVDDTLRVPGHDWLYVIGDANGRALLTHMGKYQGRLAADRILGREVAAAQRRRAQPARDLHRPAGGRGRPHAGQRPGGRHRRPRGRRPHRGQRRRHASSAPAPRAPRASSSTRTAASSSAPPSPDPRSPRRCTRRRSP